jgi:hypothetical protein
MNRLVAVCVFSVAFLAAATVPAQDQGTLGSVLRGLAWNASKTDVLKHFENVKDSEFRAEAGKLRDPLLKETLRKKKHSQYQRIEKSYQRLSGKRTGFEVSVITGEFAPNNGESLLVVRESNAQKYFMFADGKLWKLVVAYNSEYIEGIGFEAFVEAVSRKYGEPDETEFDEASDGQSLARAVWRDDETELRLENKTDFFNTYTMVFADRTTADRLKQINRAFGAEKPAEGRKVRSSILDIQDDGAFGGDDDVVDSLVGSKTKVDVVTGRPEDAKINRVGDDPTAAVADADLPGEGVKKKKKATRKTAGKKKKGINLGGKKAKKKKADDLIIY